MHRHILNASSFFVFLYLLFDSLCEIATSVVLYTHTYEYWPEAKKPNTSSQMFFCSKWNLHLHLYLRTIRTFRSFPFIFVSFRSFRLFRLFRSFHYPALDLHINFILIFIFIFTYNWPSLLITRVLLLEEITRQRQTKTET